MSTLDERRERASAAIALGRDPDVWEDGFARPRVFRQPIAAPSILGLFGFAGATFIVASNLAGWWGTDKSPLYLAPFAATFGGVAQFLAGMWPYRARDAIATAMHGMWGAFWITYGVLNVLLATKTLPTPTPAYHFPELGFWFFALGAVTASGFLAAVAELNLGVGAVLGTLAAGSGIAAGGLIYGSHGWTQVAGWVFVVSAALAWYTATAMMLKAAAGRTMLPAVPDAARCERPGRHDDPADPARVGGARRQDGAVATWGSGTLPQTCLFVGAVPQPQGCGRSGTHSSRSRDRHVRLSSIG
jgi:succinate-acetate transporter protein